MPNSAPSHGRLDAGFGGPRDRGTLAIAVGLVVLVTLVGTSTFGPAVAAPTGTAGAMRVASAPAPAGAGENPSNVLAPVLTASVSLGPVGTSVTFAVTGFAHGSLLTVTWTPIPAPGKVTACSGKTSSIGAFTCPAYRIPPTSAAVYTFTATDGGGHQASTTFSVLPTLSVAPATGPVGAIVILTGSAFATTTTVTATFNNVTVCGGRSANTYGNFSCAFPLPPAPLGFHNFTATDTNITPHTATAAFNVTARLSVSPAYGSDGVGFGPAGSTARFNATGFPAGVALEVFWSIGLACALTTSPLGGAVCNYTVPSDVPGGVYTFTAAAGATRSTVGFSVTYLRGNPPGATVGTGVTISGGGFSPNSTITVGWGGGTLFAGPTNGTGNFVPFVFTVPYLSSGGYAFHATDARGVSAGFDLAVIPSLLSLPVGGPPGTAVTWSGNGFAGGSSVGLSWTAGTACASAPTNASGSFSCGFTVPISTAGGVYTFTARDGSGNTANTSFTVTFLRALPSAGVVNSSVNLTGGGFASGVTYNVTTGSTKVCTGTTSSSGTFSCAPFKVGPTPAGPLAFVATDAKGTSASATYTIVPKLVVKPTKPAQAPVGTKLTFTGTGYAASAAVTVGWSEGTACGNTTSASGGFSCSFVLPPAPAGVYPFTAVDADSNTASAPFTIVSHLAAAPASGAVGSLVELQATALASVSPVQISSPLGVACTGTTDPMGSFWCSYPLPPTVKGTVNFTAIDTSSDSASALFSVGPQLLVTTTSNPLGPLLTGGPVGTLLVFVGTGFAASSLATVAMPSGAVCSNTTNSLGSFSCAWVLAPTGAQHFFFSATDAAMDNASVRFNVTPQLTSSVPSGPVGTPMTFTGTGFASTIPVNVTAGAATVCSSTTGAFGGFSCSGSIPAFPTGNLTLNATIAARAFASTVFRVTPHLLSVPSSGPVGTNVTFLGTGFAPDSAASVAWAHGTVCSATTAPNGTFDCSILMPPAAAGSQSFNATDATGGSASATFSVVTSFSAGLSASPGGGPPGTLVTLQGTGFAASAVVNVTWVLGLACSNTSDLSGSFSCRFSIPLGTAGGAYSFTGSDGRGDSASAGFVVTFLLAQPGFGPVGSTVTFTGGGFADAKAYSVTWSVGTACSGTTTATGGFGCTYLLPATASGPVTFTATDASSTSATAVFRVTPVLVESVGSGPVGTSVMFSGSAFRPSSAYQLTWSGGTACSGTTSVAGRMACNYTLPATPGGSYRFTAADSGANRSSVLFTVLPSLADTPGSGPVGTTVTFTGDGYAAGARLSVVGFQNSCTSAATTAGSFSCSFAIAPRPAGSYAFSSYTASGAAIVSTAFLLVPNLTVTPVTGPSGTSLTFWATGFGSSVGIALTWAGGSVCSGTTSAAGTFGCSFSVPISLSGGAATFSAVDSLGHSAHASVLVVPALGVSPNFGGAGTTVQFTGVGFQSTSPLTLSWSGGTVCATTTNASGMFRCTFAIPIGTAGGSYVFSATDGAGRHAVTSYVVTFVSVLPGSASVGTVLTFHGGGYDAGAPFAVTWLGGTACSGTTDSAGTFRCNYTLGAAVAGPHTFTAHDGPGFSATTIVSVVPSLASTPPSGPTGSVLTFRGSGFGGNLTVAVNWSLGAVCSSTTDAVGNFSCSFTVPSVSTGLYTFTAVDAASNRASSEFDLSVPQTFALNFTETGLAAGSSWTVTVNGVAVTTNTTSASFLEPNGGYSYTVRAAGYVAAPGSGTVTVAGAALAVAIVFSVALYPVVFNETGLSGTEWTVTLGTVTLSTTGASLSFPEPNGTFNYSVGGLPGYIRSLTVGSVTVAGTAPAPLRITFTPVTYTISFAESGLPSGYPWNVTLNGVTTASTGAFLSITVMNGTWTFDAQAAGYASSPWGGTIHVVGLNVGPITVTFTQSTYPVTFTTQGLPAAGAAWTLVVGTVTYHETGTTAVVTKANGNYTWQASASGYRIAPSTGFVVVNGAAPASVLLQFTLVTYPITFTESGLPPGTAWAVSVLGGAVANRTNASIALQLSNGSYTVLFDAPAGYLANPSGAVVNVSGQGKTVQVSMVSIASLVAPPPDTVLGFDPTIGYLILAGIFGGALGGGVAVGYLFARRRLNKSPMSDFL